MTRPCPWNPVKVGCVSARSTCAALAGCRDPTDHSPGTSPKEHCQSVLLTALPCPEPRAAQQGLPRPRRAGAARAGQSLTLCTADGSWCNKSPHCHAHRHRAHPQQLQGWRKAHVTGWLREKQHQCFPPAAKPHSVLVSVPPNSDNLNPCALVVFHLFLNSLTVQETAEKQISAVLSKLQLLALKSCSQIWTYRLLCTTPLSEIMCNRSSLTLMSKEIQKSRVLNDSPTKHEKQIPVDRSASTSAWPKGEILEPCGQCTPNLRSKAALCWSRALHLTLFWNDWTTKTNYE